MNASSLEQIVQAVLYEGYVLYPYRPSSKKNHRERFTFGRVYPHAYSLAQNGAEPFLMQTECLVRLTGDSPRLSTTVRFLQPMAREIGQLEVPLNSWPEGAHPPFKLVPQLSAGTELFQTWHEAVERQVGAPAINLESPSPTAAQSDFSFTGSRRLEPIRDGALVVGVFCRTQHSVAGRLEVEVSPVEPRLRKITVRVLNRTPLSELELGSPDAVLMRTFASTHTVLNVEGGEFISLLDPPSDTVKAAKQCHNIGAWPVLVGDEAKRERDTMLSSPIILYDYPKIAPESAGPLFDGTEIDEILTLRIQTLTDEEKREIRGVDELARRLLERTEALPGEALLQMHGTVRDPGAQAPIDFDDFFGASTPLQGVTVAGVFLRAGDRVRVRPKARADVFDMALSGQTAVIQAVEQDLERRVYLAVVFENDPGKDLGLMRQTGHRFFYAADEVEPLPSEVK